MRENRKKEQKKKQEECNRKTTKCRAVYIYLVLDESIPSTHKNYQETKYKHKHKCIGRLTICLMVKNRSSIKLSIRARIILPKAEMARRRLKKEAFAFFFIIIILVFIIPPKAEMARRRLKTEVLTVFYHYSFLSFLFCYLLQG